MNFRVCTVSCSVDFVVNRSCAAMNRNKNLGCALAILSILSVGLCLLDFRTATLLILHVSELCITHQIFPATC